MEIERFYFLCKSHVITPHKTIATQKGFAQGFQFARINLTCAATGKCVEAPERICHAYLSNEEESPFTCAVGYQPSIVWAHNESCEWPLTAGIWTKTNHLSAPGRRKINVTNLCNRLMLTFSLPLAKK